MRVFLKTIVRIFATIFLLFSIVIGMFFFDSGRNILLSGVTKYFQMQNIAFTIKGLDRGITKIEEIFIKSPDGIELIFSNVSLKRPNLKFSFSTKFFLNAARQYRSSIYVDKFVLNGGEEEIDLNEKLKDLVPLMRALRIFIADLSLGHGVLNILGNTWTLDGLRYESKMHKDRLYSKIDNHYVLDVLYKWQGLECVESNIKFEKFMNLDGELYIKNPEKGISEYRFNAANSEINILSHGLYKDFMIDIAVQNVYLRYKNRTYNLKGNLDIIDKKAYIVARLDLNDFIDGLPARIKRNFKNVISSFIIRYYFSETEKSTIDIKFEKSSETLGNIKGYLQNNHIELSGDIDWIDLYGLRLKKILLKSNKLEDFNIKIEGDNFNIISDIKINKIISIDKFKFESKNCGFLQLSKPCVLDKESECCFDFKFDRFDFLDKTSPIAGNAKGAIIYKNGSIIAHCNSKNLRFENIRFRDFNLKIDDEKIRIASKLNNDLSLEADGKFYESYKKISFKNFSIDSAENTLKTKSFDIDLEKDNYKISCDLLNKKSNKKGSADIIKNKAEADIKLDSFQTGIISEICGNWIPNSNLSGNIKLKSENELMIGSGKLTIYGLISRTNKTDVSLELIDTGMYLDVTLKNHNELFRGNLFIPICFSDGGTISKNLYTSSLNCHIYGNTRIENLLEFSDKIDARGLLNCDIKISGSFENPIISGNANLQKAYFVINDIFLRNGTISLSCKGNKILISQAEFTDTQKKKLNISGNGIFYFDNITPNIKTDLSLNFNDFTLFDSDNMKISLLGNGKITGDINNLLISGDIDVTKFRMQNFDSENVEKNDDIIIENERNIEKQSSKKKEKDFCKYNVNMRCPKVIIIGSIFEIMLSGNLKLLSHENTATLAGLLKLKSGRLDLFGKRLKFTKGEVEFIEEYPFDPIAILKCSKNFDEMIVYLEIQNHPKKGSSLNLYSVPNYSQDVILAYILFGKELKYLSVSEAAQLANVVARFQRKGYIFSLLNTFQSIGIVDTLSFSGNERRSDSLYSDEQSSTEQNNLNISAGKYIHDNIYISVNRKSDNITTFDVDLSLTPKMSIKANSNGEAGVSWKYKY